MKHDFFEREDSLGHCKVCGGAEASLTTECPGVRITEEQDRAIVAAELDFVGGVWQRFNPQTITIN